ncbi:MAG: fused MFS/spermidine synthase [Gammaproteobacteria bacterium]
MQVDQALNPELSGFSPQASVPRLWVWVLILLYFVSGLTSLAYEVLWARMLGLQFGVSIFGVVVTVATFMAGLGLGSLLGVRFARNIRAPLVAFAALEVGIALYALCMPWMQQMFDGWLGVYAAQASLTAWYVLQSLTALVLLFIPALAMGAGFPLVLRVLAGGAASPSVSLGKIYGFNAVGGAVGALLPLLLLPWLGWSSAVQVVAGIGLCVGIAAFFLSFTPLTNAATAKENPEGGVARLSFVSLAAYAGVGAAALMLQVGWTRLFGMILLRTEYVLAVLLAVFLVGIGLGSLAARHMRGVRWFAVLPLLGGSFSLLGLWLVPKLAGWVEQAHFSSLAGALWWQGLAVAALTLPVTFILGAWLPLLNSRLGDQHGTGSWLYGVNSLGAALGAVLAGFVLIPWLGTMATLCVAAVALFACGMAWADGRWPWLAMLGVVVLAGVGRVYELPAVSALLPVTQAGSQDVYVHEDAISITHVVERIDDQRLLLADLQRMDASSDPAAVEAQQNQARLPLMLHPAPRSVLFLGLGTGISAAGSLPYPQLSRKAVELSQGAITAAAQWFAPVNQNVMGKLAVTRDDARRFLRRDTGHYDVIIGDLFHPDLVGHSALLSVQQFQRARDRLTENGLFVQWLALNQFDAGSLDIIFRSFRQVFPGAVIFMDGFRVALVGPKDVVQGAPALLANLGRLAQAGQSAATGGEGAWTWLGRYWGPIPPSVGPVQDEWAPQIEYRLPRARYRDAFNLDALLSRLLGQRPGLMQAALALNVPANAMQEFERSYVASFLAVRSWVAALRGDNTGEAQRLMRLAFEANPRDRWIGFDLADKMLATLPQALDHGMNKRQALQAILKVRPDHAEALRALWRVEKDAGDGKMAALYRARLKVVSPLDRDIYDLGMGQAQKKLRPSLSVQN